MSSSDYSLATMDSTLAGLVICGINWIFFLAWQAETSFLHTFSSISIILLVVIAVIIRYAWFEVNFEDLFCSCIHEDFTKWVHKLIYQWLNRSLNFLRSVVLVKWIWRTLGTILVSCVISSLFAYIPNIVWFWIWTTRKK